MLLKKVDGAIGSLLARFWPRPARRGGPPGPAPSLLLIRPGGIGDAVLLVPAIRAFRAKFPDSDVTVLAERRNGVVFALCPDVAQVLLYDRPQELMTALRRRYDLVIDTEQWHRLSAVVARLIHSELKIGFATNERKRLFNIAVSYSQEDYEADSFLRLLEPLGVGEQEVGYPFLDVPEQSAKRAEEMLAPLAGRPFVTLFPGASIPERRWGAEKFRELAAWLNDRELQAVVVGGGQDRAAGEKILAGSRGLNLAGQTSLPETAAVLKRSRLLVSGDSGVLHLAVGLGIPTVSLFGPGIAAKWAPRGGRHAVINLNLPCSPCTRYGTTPPCPIHARCIQDISVDLVYKTIVDLMTGGGMGRWRRDELHERQI